MAIGHDNDNCTSWRINLWAKPASQSWTLEEREVTVARPEAWTLDKSISALSYGKRMETERIAPVQTNHHHLEMDLHKIFPMQTERVSVKAVNPILLLLRVGAWYSTRAIKITFQAKARKTDAMCREQVV